MQLQLAIWDVKSQFAIVFAEPILIFFSTNLPMHVIKMQVWFAIQCDHQKMKVAASWSCRGHSACGVASVVNQNRWQVMLWISNAQIFQLCGA